MECGAGRQQYKEQWKLVSCFTINATKRLTTTYTLKISKKFRGFIGLSSCNRGVLWYDKHNRAMIRCWKAGV